MLLEGPAQEFRIVGLFGFGDRFDFGAVTFAAFDLATAQGAFDATGALDRIYVERDADVSQAELMRRLQGTLGQGFEVLTAAEAAEQVGEPVRDFLGFFTFALLGFAAIGVVVGAFVIFNTFTILVTQRTRELGLLRAMGASGGQVVGLGGARGAARRGRWRRSSASPSACSWASGCSSCCARSA